MAKTKINKIQLTETEILCVAIVNIQRSLIALYKTADPKKAIPALEESIQTLGPLWDNISEKMFGPKAVIHSPAAGLIDLNSILKKK